MDDGWHVRDSRHLVLFEVRVQHNATPGIHYPFFSQGKAKPLGDGADHLTVHHRRVDDTAAVMGGNHTEDRYLTGLYIHLDLSTLHTKRAHRLVLRILPASTMTLDHVWGDTPGDFLQGKRPLWLTFHPDLAVAHAQAPGFFLK